MHETHTDGRLAARGRFHRTGAGLRIVGNILVQRFQVVERLVFTEYLHECRQRGVSRARRGGIRHLYIALEFRLHQIGPAGGRREFLLGQHFGVEAEAQCAGVNAHRFVVRDLRLILRPRVQVFHHRRLVNLGKTFFRRLQMWVTGAAEPDVAFRIGGLSLHLREGLA